MRVCQKYSAGFAIRIKQDNRSVLVIKTSVPGCKAQTHSNDVNLHGTEKHDNVSPQSSDAKYIREYS